MKGSRGHYLVSLARKNYDQVHDCPSVKNIENENVKQPFPIDDNSHQEVVDRPTTCGYGKRITEDDTAIPTIKKAKSNISLPDLESEKENNQALINPTEVSNSSQQKNNSPIPSVDEAKQIKNRSLSSSSSSSCSTCSSCSSSSNSSLSSVDDTSEDPNYSSNSSSSSSSSGSLDEGVKQNDAGNKRKHRFVKNFHHPRENVRRVKRNPGQWMKNIAKTMRNSGQSYSSIKTTTLADGTKDRTLVTRKAKTMRPPCDVEKCRLICANKISDEQRQTLFKEYWAMADLQQQRMFIVLHR